MMGLAVMFASMLFIVPGLILYMMWSVATPACVVERLGPFRSMARSRALTKGHRWKIFGLLLLTLIPGVIIGAVIGALGAPGLGVPGLMCGYSAGFFGVNAA